MDYAIPFMALCIRETSKTTFRLNTISKHSEHNQTYSGVSLRRIHYDSMKQKRHIHVKHSLKIQKETFPSKCNIVLNFVATE